MDAKSRMGTNTWIVNGWDATEWTPIENMQDIRSFASSHKKIYEMNARESTLFTFACRCLQPVQHSFHKPRCVVTIDVHVCLCCFQISYFIQFQTQKEKLNNLMKNWRRRNVFCLTPVRSEYRNIHKQTKCQNKTTHRMEWSWPQPISYSISWMKILCISCAADVNGNTRIAEVVAVELTNTSRNKNLFQIKSRKTTMM